MIQRRRTTVRFVIRFGAQRQQILHDRLGLRGCRCRNEFREIIPLEVRLELHQDIQAPVVASLLQCRGMALRIVYPPFVHIRAARSRTRTRPQQKAYPFHVAFVAEMPQGSVGLLLEGFAGIEVG